MCGIFGYIGSKTDAANIVLDGLKRLEYRGYDSWGVAAVPEKVGKNKISIKKDIGKIGEATVADLPASSLAFGHTRWATHGGVTVANAHPHLDCSQHIAVIHNGIIENYLAIKDKLVKKGHIFHSDTDTEIVAHLIEDHSRTNSFAEAVRLTFLELEGMNAIIAINLQDHALVAARMGSPLVLGWGKDGNYLASDPAALLPHTKIVYFLEDGELAIVKEDDIHVKNLKTWRAVTPKKQRLSWNITQAEKGNYKHFMLKEIHEQPKMLRSIASSAGVYTSKIAKSLKRADQTYLIGSGSSAYEALIGTYLFATIARHRTTAVVASELSHVLQFLTRKSTVLALSQSGETMDLLAPLKELKGPTIMALVNVLGSSLYRLAKEKIVVGAGPEKAVATTKALTGKIAHLILLAFALDNRLIEGKQVIEQSAQAAQAILQNSSVAKIKKLAHVLAKHNSIYVIGRGISYPASLETALKIKEIAYIHAEGLAGGELKHGPLALVESGTPCIAFLPNDDTYQATLAGAMEMKARGGYLIGVSSKNHELFDSYINVSDAGVGTVIPNIIFAQVLAYHLANIRGLDPDMPRNLAKSVTVK